MSESKRYALVRGGMVVDVLMWDGEAGETWEPPTGLDPEAPPPEAPEDWVPFSKAFGEDAKLVDTNGTGAGPGWAYDGQTFTAPPEQQPPELPKVRVVTRRQGRRALLAAGLLDKVQLVIDALPEPKRSEAQIDWDDATEFDRDSELVQALAPALGLDEDGLDELFASAATF